MQLSPDRLTGLLALHRKRHGQADKAKHRDLATPQSLGEGRGNL